MSARDELFRGQKERMFSSVEEKREFLLDQNEEQLGELHDKVVALREITADIGTEIEEQNDFLGDLEGDFGTASGLLSGTMHKLDRALKNRKIPLFYIVGIILILFFVSLVVVIL